jgi:phthalate 4,5-dioxygenase
MLSREDNELLCRVGPGTLMGELWRGFWIPALMPSELPEPDCPLVRIRLLGEDLVAFRDTDGRVGLVAENCPHRGASLFFGRNEESGLRCVYHGWKFDADGACIDMPNEPSESNFKHKVHVQAYETAEWGGIVWAYMGPKDRRPELPQHEWCGVPEDHRYLGKWIQECNWVQCYEGEIDTSHISFLHSGIDPIEGTSRFRGLAAKDGAPRLLLKETDYGLTYGARRQTGNGDYYWRVTQFMLPDYSLIPGPKWPRGGRCWVPIDDHRTWVFAYTYNPDRALTDDELFPYTSGAQAFASLIPGTFRTKANKDNDYLIDRQMQKTENFTGIWGTRNQDTAVVESMGPIMDRTKERLGTADLAIITARRILLRTARRLQEGIEPYAASHGDVYRVRALDCVDAEADFEKLLEKYRERTLMTAQS